MKSITSTFLSCATDHDQSLEFIDCEVVERCSDTYSEAFPLINEAADIPCIFGEFKSLRFCTDFSSFPLQWLFQYTKLHLERLELTYLGFEPMYVQSFGSYPSASIETLCVKLGSVGYIGDVESSKRALTKFLKFQFLSEIELKSLFDRDNSMFSILTDSFRQPWQLTSLKRLRLGRIMT